MSKGKGLFKKLLAVAAIAGGAAVLLAKCKKNSCRDCAEDEDFEDDCSDGESGDSSRNYVPLTHGDEEETSEEDEAKEPVSEEAPPEEPVSEEAEADKPVSVDASAQKASPSAEEIAAKLEQAVAETEARYEEAVKEAKASEDK